MNVKYICYTNMRDEIVQIGSKTDCIKNVLKAEGPFQKVNHTYLLVFTLKSGKVRKLAFFNSKGARDIAYNLIFRIKEETITLSFKTFFKRSVFNINDIKKACREISLLDLIKEQTVLQAKNNNSTYIELHNSRSYNPFPIDKKGYRQLLIGDFSMPETQIIEYLFLNFEVPDLGLEFIPPFYVWKTLVKCKIDSYA